MIQIYIILVKLIAAHVQTEAITCNEWSQGKNVESNCQRQNRKMWPCASVYNLLHVSADCYKIDGSAAQQF